MTLSRPGRRLAALTAGVGLVAGSLLVAPAGSAAAAPLNDSAAAVAGGQWLAEEVGADGLLENAQFPDFFDYGLTVDAGLTLTDFDGTFDARLADITGAMSTEESVNGYLGFGDPDETSAGAAGKLMSFLQTQDVDVTDVDGVDLQARLEATVSDDPAYPGRIENITEFTENANAIGQGFAARALAVAGSVDAAAATDFFLDQQCSEGYFRVFFNDKAQADQTCDGAGPDGDDAPSPDATGLAVLNLLATEPAPGSPAATAIDDAVAWLLAEQADDGSFLGAPPTDTPNTNSTGLAAQALAAVGEDEAATAAATYIAGLQVSACDAGVLRGDGGAVAYDQAAYDAALVDGIPVELRDQFRRAGGQAISALRSLPDEEGTPTLAATGARYVKAASTAQVRVAGLAGGREVCIVGPTGTTSVTGPATTAGVRVPAGTASRTYRIEGEQASVSLRALGAKRLNTTLGRASVARGNQQAVTVRGLAANEKVTIRFRGRVVAEGVATQAGFFKRSFRVTGRTGRAPVRVTGQFAATRFAERGFTVR